MLCVEVDQFLVFDDERRCQVDVGWLGRVSRCGQLSKVIGCHAGGVDAVVNLEITPEETCVDKVSFVLRISILVLQASTHFSEGCCLRTNDGVRAGDFGEDGDRVRKGFLIDSTLLEDDRVPR